MEKSVSFLFSYDSYLKAIIPIAEYFFEQGYKVNFYLYDLGNDYKQISEPDLIQSKFKTSPIVFKNINNLDLNSEIAVFFAFGGNLLRKSLNIFKNFYLKDNLDKRPLAITLYSGIKAPLQYDGYIARVESDIILFNNQFDLDEYNQFCKSLNINAKNGMLFGMAMLPNKEMQKSKEIKNVTFIEQPILPRSKVKRYYLANKLIEYANYFKDRNVTILMRDISSNTCAHVSKYPMNKILNDIGNMPSNLNISNEKLENQIKKTDLCITISSTVSLEAIQMGIKTAIISDFGFEANLGNCGYLESGYTASFSDLIKDNIPNGNLEWTKSNIINIDNNLSKLLQKIETNRDFSFTNADISNQFNDFDKFKKEFKKTGFNRQIYYKLRKIYKKYLNKYKYYASKVKNI